MIINNKLVVFKNGFTLIEILVTITIVGLMLVVSIPNFRNFKYKNDLLRGADIVQSGIYETRNLALAPTTTKTENIKYYVFEVTENTSTYKISEIAYLPDEIEAVNTSNVIKTEDLPNNVKFKNTVALYFSIEEQGKIALSVGGNEIDIYHTQIKNNEKKIEINAVTGQVIIK